MFLAFLLVASLTTQTSAPLSHRATANTPTDSHYRIYAATGTAVSMEELLDALDHVEVVFIGESHDDPAAHAFEAELLQRAAARYLTPQANKQRRSVTLALEMFERDTQIVLDEYLRGLVTERHFLLSSRPWNNYQQDYRPLIEFAREQNVPVLASNAPARYVNRVSRLGPPSLTELTSAARAWLPPLPYAPASTAYAAKFKQLMGESQMAGTAQSQQSPHGATYLLEAQTLRDATMAQTIAEHLKRHKDALVLHVNGNFHSEERLGIPEHLRHYRPQTRLLVINIVSDKSYPNYDAERFGKMGDFIVLTDPSLPRSF